VRAKLIGLIITALCCCTVAYADTPESSEAEVWDAYQAGPSIYEMLVKDIQAMPDFELMETLMENSRRVEATNPAGPQGNKLIISKSWELGGDHIKTIDPPILGPVQLLPHEVYEPEGLKAAIEKIMAQFDMKVRLAEGSADTLVEIFMKGPEEDRKVAESLRAGRIPHSLGNTYALEWLLKVALRSSNVSHAETATAWMLDPSYRDARAKEGPLDTSCEEELLRAQKALVLLQGQEGVKRRDLLYCLLKQNDTHPNQKALDELQYITLYRMAQWGEAYPEADFERISDKLGFWMRQVVKLRYMADDTPVLAGDLPRQDINLYRCPFLTAESFR